MALLGSSNRSESFPLLQMSTRGLACLADRKLLIQILHDPGVAIQNRPGSISNPVCSSLATRNLPIQSTIPMDIRLSLAHPSSPNSRPMSHHLRLLALDVEPGSIVVYQRPTQIRRVAQDGEQDGATNHIPPARQKPDARTPVPEAQDTPEGNDVVHGGVQQGDLHLGADGLAVGFVEPSLGVHLISLLAAGEDRGDGSDDAEGLDVVGGFGEFGESGEGGDEGEGDA